MRQPAQFAQDVEENPQLPRGTCERVSGYGVMGLTFQSGHVLGLRRWTASSIGDRFTSIWHRDPAGHWTFYESVACQVACSRYFSDEVDYVREGPIDVTWEAAHRMRVRTADGSIDWSILVGSTLVTRMMSAIGSIMPTTAWRSGPVLRAAGALAGWALRVGKVRLTGTTSNGQHFDANPMRIWFVTDSRAVVQGQDLGPVGPLTEQAHMADLYFPQRGILAVGRVFLESTTHAEPRLGQSVGLPSNRPVL
jgi:hypothetical protein